MVEVVIGVVFVVVVEIEIGVEIEIVFEVEVGVGVLNTANEKEEAVT